MFGFGLGFRIWGKRRGSELERKRKGEEAKGRKRECEIELKSDRMSCPEIGLHNL